jgi:hypothetical protein
MSSTAGFKPDASLTFRPMLSRPNFGRLVATNGVDYEWIVRLMNMCTERSVKDTFVRVFNVRVIDVNRMSVVTLPQGG